MIRKQIKVILSCIACVGVLVSFNSHAVSDQEDAEGPGPERMMEIMQAHITGGQLYRKKKFDEAVEHLEIAAKGGMKRSQAQLSAIYASGAEGVDRDMQKSVGWLGVAAHGTSEPAYKNQWKQMYSAINKAQQPMVDKLVDVYVQNYGPEATGVSCDYTKRAGSNMARLACTFDDLHKYRDELNAETYSALSSGGQITDYGEAYSSGGFSAPGGGGGGGGGGQGGGGGGGGGF